MLSDTSAGLYCEAGAFHIDPWGAVERAVITHAHGDHARPGSAAYLCAEPGAGLLRRRLGPDARIETLPYGQRLTLGGVAISLHPAGHVLGSAQVRIEGPSTRLRASPSTRLRASPGGVWVVSGDYKRDPDPTCAPFEPLRCDTFVTESTFGLPIYRWDPVADVIADIASWWNGNQELGKTSVLFCYTLGKAQRLLAELARHTDRPVYVHGMMESMIEGYREAGIAMLPVRPVIDRTSAAARKQAPLAGELVLAPILARGTPWMRRLGDVSDGFVSGHMRVRGVRRQRAVDRGFVLSDHADWPALLHTIAGTGAHRVLTTHGHAEPLSRYLTGQGVDSAVIRTAWEGEGE